jgi:hypothetical protein
MEFSPRLDRTLKPFGEDRVGHLQHADVDPLGVGFGRPVACRAKTPGLEWTNVNSAAVPTLASDPDRHRIIRVFRINPKRFVNRVS